MTKSLFFVALMWLWLAGLAQATDLYVAKCTNGIATYSPGGVGSCTGGSNLVYSSLTNAMAVAAAGDNIYIRAGSWPGLAFSATQPSGTGPAGTSGSGAAGVISDFASATLITVSAYCPGGVCEAVTITQASLDTIGISASYVSYENLQVDATTSGEQPFSLGPATHHVRLLNNTIRRGRFNCIQIPEGSHHHWVKGNDIGECGGDNPGDPYRYHGIYNGENDSLYEQNTIHDVIGVGGVTRGYCVQNYPATQRNTWRSNTMYNCEGMTNGGSGNIIYNNVVRDSGGGIAISAGRDGSSGNVVYNNTLVDNRDSGIDLQGSTGTILRNNIVANNGINIYHTGSGATVSNNLCSTTGGGTTNCSHTAANVGAINFTNYAGNVFTLQDTSPAVNVGTPTITGSISVPACPTGTPYCYNSTAPDMGAFESGAAPGPTCPAAPALVASYSFDNVATDGSGNLNHATLGTGVSYISGKYNQGVHFSGTGGVTVPHSASLFLCTGFTLEMWASVPALTDFNALIASNYESQDGWFLYGGTTGYAQVGAPVGGYCPAAGSCATAVYGTNLPTSTLAHVALTYDSTLGSANVKLWVNGSNVVSANGTTVLADWTGNMCIGCSPFGEYVPSGSIIDEVRIYNYARSGAQITSDMNTPLGTLVAPTLTLSGTMKFGASATALKQ